MLHFRLQGNAEKVLYGNDDLVFQSDDLFRSRLPRGIGYHQRLFLVDPDIAFSVTFPAALLDQPCRRNFHESRTGIKVRDFILQAVLAFRIVFYYVIRGLRDHRVLEETAGTSHDCRVRELGITDFQDSKNVFYIRLVDNDTLEAVYPQLRGKLSTPSITVSEYAYDDAVDTSNKSVVVDWYYKKNSGEKTVLHFVKFVNDEVLFATENDEEFRENGLYDHGKYPFIFDPLYTVEGSPAGFGVIDIGKSAQKYIDKMNSAILTNALVNAQPRVFARTDGGLNEKEYLNPEKPIVHVNSMSEDVVRAVDTKPLSDIYISVFDRKIEEIKETTGNRDVANGGTTSGVTAASAIAAMQEASGKLSRDMLKQSYTAYKELVFMIIELVRQFYDTPRCFRIIGENGAYSFESFSNKGIVPQMQGGNEFGVETGYRVPEFDIEVTAQKASPYSKMAQNELALQFYNLGFFLPQNADQSLACLEMMDFDRKEKIIQKVQQNGTLLQMVQSMQAQIQKLSEIINIQTGGALGEPDSIDGLLEGQTTPKAGAVETAIETDQLGGAKAKESGVTENARKQTAESTTP